MDEPKAYSEVRQSQETSKLFLESAMTITEQPAEITTDEMLIDVGGGMELCFVSEGDPSNPPLLLISGLGLQLTYWPREFVDRLLDSGFRVIRFDNRDAGRSTKTGIKPPTIAQLLTRRFSGEQYVLADMAADTIGLLDGLGIEKCHLAGMSMGGMIGQTIAARYPDRTASLTSIMSTTGSRRVGQPALATQALIAKPPAKSREAAAARHVEMMRHIGSPDFEFDEVDARATAELAWDRSDGKLGIGIGRQLGAILKTGDRTGELQSVGAPTLVIHGSGDRMINPSGGKATAAAIKGSRLLLIDGMGHDMPAGLLEQLATETATHAAAVQAG